jgi:hypothetical protein
MQRSNRTLGSTARARSAWGLALAVCCLWPTAVPSAHEAAEDMAAAATRFLAALTPAQKARATFALRDDERQNWHFFPKDRPGIAFKEMTPVQRHQATALLASGLSHRGYLKAVTIMSLEQVLHDLEQGSGPKRDPELYHVTVFGEPGATNTWGWRVEGHHLSVNFTIVEGKAFAATPSFMGANPAEVRSGPHQGLRVLGREEDLARQLVKSLEPEQRKAAVFSETAPADIITGAQRKVSALKPEGLQVAGMTADQKQLLKELVAEYVFRHRAAVADQDLRRIHEAGTDGIRFAWAGGLEAGQPHYYRVQGPTFLLEYDNTQNQANHAHAVWRDFENDFGEDLLRRHYQQDHR